MAEPFQHLDAAQEARRANKVVRTVTRYMEVCKYVKNKSSRRQGAGTAVSMKDGGGQEASSLEHTTAESERQREI